MNKKSAWAGILVIMILLLSGCGLRAPSVQEGSSEGLQAITEKMMALNEVYAQFGVQPRSIYTENGKVYLEVYNAQKPWQSPSAADITRLEQAIYDALGTQFPLQIQSFALPDQADVTGKITALDGNRMLIVDDKGSDAKESKAAMWVKFPSNVIGGVKIGYRVNVWSNGMTEDSYPGQTSGVQLQVVEFDTGNGDLQGRVTDVHLLDEDENNRYVEIDGRRQHVFPFTLYWVIDKQAQAKDIQVGNYVEVWFSDYQAKGEEYITQLRVVR